MQIFLTCVYDIMKLLHDYHEIVTQYHALCYKLITTHSHTKEQEILQLCQILDAPLKKGPKKIIFLYDTVTIAITNYAEPVTASNLLSSVFLRTLKCVTLVTVQAIK